MRRRPGRRPCSANQNNNVVESRDYSNFDLEKYKKKGRWTIVGALDCLLQLARGSELSDAFWDIACKPLRYLRKELGLTDIQLIVLAIMIESGESVSWRSLGNFIGVSRLTMMTYSEEVDQLLEKGWTHRAVYEEDFTNYQGFKLNFGVVSALRQNKVFVPEKLDGLTLQQFMDRLEIFVNRNLDSNSYENADVVEWVDWLVAKNPDLSVCKILREYTDINEKLVLVMIIVDYAQYANSDGEGLWLSTIQRTINTDYTTLGLIDNLKAGTLQFFTDNLVEFECNDGVVNNERYLLSKHMKNEVLAEYKPRRSEVSSSREKNFDAFLKKHDDIKTKELFYNKEEGSLVGKLTSLLNQENFEGVQKRLEEEGMRKGFACIFHGAPGTGKTETVMQIARQVGRDIMQVDISTIRDKWVGESEKNIKAVFERYKEACESGKTKPILLFNEADALFNKRMESAQHSVDKMNNAMQNIILQEIENLDGILIATTNLTGSLDKAFERRFIFKVEFKKPVTEVKAKIWKSMFKDALTEDDAMKLAADFDFSGGEIENIARKRAIDYILEGKELDMKQLYEYCREERLTNTSVKPIGFNQ